MSRRFAVIRGSLAVSGEEEYRVVRISRAAAVTVLVAVALGGGQAARADVPAIYRVCADVPWNKPSPRAERRHLLTNSRWGAGERADPSFLLDFPFVVRVLSASINTDLTALNGYWTLSARSWRTIDRRCPIPGGSRRNFGVYLKGWAVQRAVLADAGGLTIYATPRPGRFQVLNFPGYNSRSGYSGRRVTLINPGARSCFISSLSVDDDTSYNYLQTVGLDCQETVAVTDALEEAQALDGAFGRLTCASGQVAWGGVTVTCRSPDGEKLRLRYSDPSVYE